MIISSSNNMTCFRIQFNLSQRPAIHRCFPWRTHGGRPSWVRQYGPASPGSSHIWWLSIDEATLALNDPGVLLGATPQGHLYHPGPRGILQGCPDAGSMLFSLSYGRTPSQTKQNLTTTSVTIILEQSILCFILAIFLFFSFLLSLSLFLFLSLLYLSVV